MRYGDPVNSAFLHALYVAVPLGVLAVLAGLIYSRKSNHPATYQLSERWTHGPVLWSAVDESLPGGHGDSALSVGGGASGRW